MPPKAKFEREEIIEAALNLVKEEGSSALTARALAKRLGSSPRPIFTVFQSMEEVQDEVRKAARACYNRYVSKGLSKTDGPRFKGVGEQYIRFAVEEPKLFGLLFMKEQEKQPNIKGILPVIDENYEDILLSIVDGYGLSDAQAQRLYQHLWIYTHGIATLFATGMCCFTLEQIGGMMTEIFTGLLKEIKGMQRHKGEEKND
ncbi:MAG: TetR/AcrR family transcriptional regulator [Lachnospiraceae bacterium]|nr:TetR/AcrR family transcriptional regulator [Lachnospiraceae bacterium]